MPYKEKEKEREYNKAYYQAHREEYKSYRKAYYQAHRDEHNARVKAYQQAHREELKAYNKDYNKAHRDENNARCRAYKKSDTNSLGKTKNSVRKKSHNYLFNVLKHTKLNGYEIHHCFGYNDYRNFIYIPKSLHLQIHQFLRDNNIDADTDHYSKIVHLIIECEEYVYIKA